MVSADIDVPAFPHKFVPSSITLVQTDAWDIAHQTGRIDIRFKGMRAEVRSDMALTEQDNQTVVDLRFSVKVSVPLVGKSSAACWHET